LGLLTIAGENLSSMFRSMSITTAGGKMKFEEYRQDCIRRLQGRLGAKASRVEVRSESPRFFISYNHSDREEATALALDLARSKADVFLDHWEMAPHEEILPRIERELNESDVVVALLSPRAAESSWVRRELEIVSARQASRGGVRLIPVLLEDCALPVPIASRPYHDLRDRRRRPMVVQSILNQVLGYKPFSQRVMEFLSKPAADSPYMPNAQRNGRKMLEALGRCEEMEIANNQKWFLWEAFHKLLGDYTCTLKMGIQRQSATAKRYEFTIIDRWNNQGNVVILTADEFDRGLWQGEVDLLGRGTT
jgi:hypothetical protein